MTEAKHTPGPWKQHPDYPWIIKEDNAPISEDGVSICNTTGHPDSGFFPTPSESRANARLIAAAPEMLQRLEMCKRFLEDMHTQSPEVTVAVSQTLHETVREIITKATGK